MLSKEVSERADFWCPFSPRLSLCIFHYFESAFSISASHQWVRVIALNETAISCIHTLHARWLEYLPGSFSFYWLQFHSFPIFVIELHLFRQCSSIQKSCILAENHRRFVRSDGYVTCASGGDQFGLAAGTITLCRIGCHGNWIRGLSLQLCDDHFL